MNLYVALDVILVITVVCDRLYFGKRNLESENEMLHNLAENAKTLFVTVLDEWTINVTYYSLFSDT